MIFSRIGAGLRGGERRKELAKHCAFTSCHIDSNIRNSMRHLRTGIRGRTAVFQWREDEVGSVPQRGVQGCQAETDVGRLESLRIPGRRFPYRRLRLTEGQHHQTRREQHRSEYRKIILFYITFVNMFDVMLLVLIGSFKSQLLKQTFGPHLGATPPETLNMNRLSDLYQAPHVHLRSFLKIIYEVCNI